MDDSILDSLTNSIVDSLISSINLNSHASFVVCGGNSPLPLYNNLSKNGDAFHWYSSKQLARIFIKNEDILSKFVIFNFKRYEL